MLHLRRGTSFAVTLPLLVRARFEVIWRDWMGYHLGISPRRVWYVPTVRQRQKAGDGSYACQCGIVPVPGGM